MNFEQEHFDTLIVQEVAPRDGLQIEPTWVETADKIALIDQLSTAGFTRIEAGSFVSPKAIPALRDGEAVFTRIQRRPGVIFVALVPNLKGAERALNARADELNLVMSASQTHNRANMRMSCEASLDAFGDIVRLAQHFPVSMNATVATAFGCPFEGKIDEDRVVSIVDAYREMGISGITLADTTGMANPRQVARLVRRAPLRCGARRAGRLSVRAGRVGEHLHGRPRQHVRRNEHSDGYRSAEADRVVAHVACIARSRRAGPADESGPQLRRASRARLRAQHLNLDSLVQQHHDQTAIPAGKGDTQ